MTATRTIDITEELLRRGLTFTETCSAMEAIYSCEIEGIKGPSKPSELDWLARQIIALRASPSNPTDALSSAARHGRPVDGKKARESALSQP